MELQRLPGERVCDNQQISMQGLSAKGLKGLGGLRGQPGGPGLEARPIDRIAHERMADMGEMDPDLMGPAGLELAGQKTRDGLAVGAGISLEHLPVGHRLAAVRAYRPLVAGMGM